MSIRIAPSILAADFANLERDIAAIHNADWVHVDVMDNHFVPNLTLGLPVVERLAQVSALPIDAHLMIEDPDRWAPQYAEAGAASVTFHAEAAADVVETARSIRALGSRVGVALKPGTPLVLIEDALAEFDMVLLMTVEPGFGGQRFMPEVLPKFQALRAARERSGASLWIQVDGGVSESTVEQVVAAGADMLVAGSAVYGSALEPEADPAARVAALRALAEAAVPAGGHHH